MFLGLSDPLRVLPFSHKSVEWTEIIQKFSYLIFLKILIIKHIFTILKLLNSLIKTLKNRFFCILKVTSDFGTSASVSQRYGSEDPEPYQNVTDLEHWVKLPLEGPLNKKVLVWPDVLWIEVLCEDGHELGYAGVHVHKTRLKTVKNCGKKTNQFTDDLERGFKTKDPARAQSVIFSTCESALERKLRFCKKIYSKCATNFHSPHLNWLPNCQL